MCRRKVQGAKVMKRLRVLVVDDSAFMRKIISNLINEAPGLEAVGTARDGQDALAKVREFKPDVITLDVEMPRMDGLTFLKRLMADHPIPVVMLSSLTQKNAQTTIQALSLGAVDFVAKPSGTISLDIRKVGDELVRKLKAAAKVNTDNLLQGTAGQGRRPPARVKDQEQVVVPGSTASRVVVIGASTGGPGALQVVIPSLPGSLAAGVLVVQHMPPGFTRSLAERLDSVSALRVKEAQRGDPIREGSVLVAPGGHHLVVTPDRTVTLEDSPPVHGVRPAVDVTLKSAVRVYGGQILGVILTGMGFDGAQGVAQVRRAGGKSIAQDEATCVVYGMPRAVVEMGNADRVLPLDEIGQQITRMVGRRRAWIPCRSTSISARRSSS